jgi:hypothetical protein
MNQELKDFIKWCDDLCIEHQNTNKFPVKHKICNKCWNEVKNKNK